MMTRCARPVTLIDLLADRDVVDDVAEDDGAAHLSEDRGRERIPLDQQLARRDPGTLLDLIFAPGTTG